ncbi:MAG: hypothetical protein AAFV93_24380, partial [Chloroflexota bacterium]
VISLMLYVVIMMFVRVVHNPTDLVLICSFPFILALFGIGFLVFGFYPFQFYKYVMFWFFKDDDEVLSRIVEKGDISVGRVMEVCEEDGNSIIIYRLIEPTKPDDTHQYITNNLRNIRPHNKITFIQLGSINLLI